MVSACLNTSFRQNDIHNLARGYAVNGTAADFSATGDGWGWEGPAGGWSMTIGDLARLMLIMQSDMVIPRTVIDSSMRKYSGTEDGLHIGLGLELSSAPSSGPVIGDDSDPTKVWYGKGGDIQGYTADFKIWPNAVGGSWGVAFMCNRKLVGKGLSNNIHDILVAGAANTTVGTGGAIAGDPPPRWLNTAIAYEPLVRQFAASYLRENPSGERAWASASRELSGLVNGPALIRTLEAGDFESAVRLLPTLRWPDGSPVTP
jgi:CubicO group peptidase (beta-lactamase class C family)